MFDTPLSDRVARLQEAALVQRDAAAQASTGFGIAAYTAASSKLNDALDAIGSTLDNVGF